MLDVVFGEVVGKGGGKQDALDVGECGMVEWFSTVSGREGG